MIIKEGLERHWIILFLFIIVTVITDCQIILEPVPISVRLSIMIDTTTNAGEELSRIVIFIDLNYGCK